MRRERKRGGDAEGGRERLRERTNAAGTKVHAVTLSQICKTSTIPTNTNIQSSLVGESAAEP